MPLSYLIGKLLGEKAGDVLWGKQEREARAHLAQMYQDAERLRGLHNEWHRANGPKPMTWSDGSVCTPSACEVVAQAAGTTVKEQQLAKARAYYHSPQGEAALRDHRKRAAKAREIGHGQPGRCPYCDDSTA